MDSIFMGSRPSSVHRSSTTTDYRALAPDGVLVVNLCGPEDRRSIERIRRSFDDRVLVVIPEDGQNRIVFAIKGERLWIRDEPTSDLVDKLRSRHAPYLIKSCQLSIPGTCLDRSEERHAPCAIEAQAQ